MKYFYMQMKQYGRGQALGEIVQEMSDRLLFTSIYIGNKLNAHKIFETLNARGMQLSSGDLLFETI